jgi:hypothetical protein
MTGWNGEEGHSEYLYPYRRIETAQLATHAPQLLEDISY